MKPTDRLLDLTTRQAIILVLPKPALAAASEERIICFCFVAQSYG